MAFTYNGFGTTYYGERDYREDGSFITTHWIVLAFIPVIPLSSFRAIPNGDAGVPIVFGSRSYATFEKGAPNWKQVLSTYAYFGLLVGWVLLVLKGALWIRPDALDDLLCIYLVIFACFVPVPTPWILRSFAKRRLRARMRVRPNSTCIVTEINGRQEETL